MKFINIITILTFLVSCSFDDKSGIWNNDNPISKNNNELKEFKTLSSSNITFNKIIPIKEQLNLKIEKSVNNYDWPDIFYHQSNNLKNFKYQESNNLILKSKKISKYQINNFLLYSQKNIILSDEKGNIFIFSVNKNKLIKKFNFYKKEFKRNSKFLNLIAEKNIIYVSDNLGYLYAYDHKKNKIIWAKNYKVPFRSNLKIVENKLIAANQNNTLYFFNKSSGEVINFIPTEDTVLKNEFKNNISSNNLNTLYLNTYGSLYSINNKTMRVNWFLNFNRSADINPIDLFESNEIIHHKDKIVLSSKLFTYILNIKTGTLNYKKNFGSQIKPILSNDYLFSITENNLLVALNSENGNIVYSYNINQKIADYLKSKKKEVEVKNIMLINDKLFVFLKSSYVLKFNINGNLEEITKLKNKLNSYPILVDGSLIYLDKKNKLRIIN